MGDRKLNIGLIFSGNPQIGGGFQQQISTVMQLRRLSDKYNFIAFVFSKHNKKILENYGIKAIAVETDLFDEIYSIFFRQDWFLQLVKLFRIRRLLFVLRTSFEKKLEAYNIDLVYFLSPSPLALDLVTHNYIITVWDLCHRDYPEFPEVSFFREFEAKEEFYAKSLKKAVAVLVESEIGKRNVIRRYGVDEHRVFVTTLTPSINVFRDYPVDVRSKYRIDGQYIYYPAQFWPHKNNVYIIDAIAILKKQGINITAVFSGSDRGNLEYVLHYARKRGVEELVRYIGFVPDEDIYQLYKQALALVMPTYFGPTNIPPLEAFEIGVPVIYSDIDYLKEQVGDAVLFCDLRNPESLATHLKNLLNSEELRKDLIEKGKKRLKELQKNDIVTVLEKILDDYSVKLRCWKDV